MPWDWVAPTKEEEEEEAPSSSPKQIMHSTNIVVHALIVLKCMVNKHVSISLDLPSWKFRPHQFWELEK